MSESSRMLTLHNGEARPLQEVPILDWQQFRSAIVDGVASGAHVAAMFGHLPDE